MNSPRLVALLHARNVLERKARLCRASLDAAQTAYAVALAEVEQIDRRIVEAAADEHREAAEAQ